MKEQRDVAASPKYRVLCLHGIGTNSEVFEAQTAALRYRLGANFEYEFLDGSFPWPALPGISEVFGNDQMYFSYHDGSGESAYQAVRDLAAYATENGPFDAVLAFSLGAALAATLLIEDASRALFRCAIFICATLPYDVEELQAGRLQLLSGEISRNSIRIPTVHAWGTNDTEYMHESAQLVQMSVEGKRVEVKHDAAHGVPTQGESLDHLAEAIISTVCGT
ncbi:uncharacterized protein RCC_09431 [Ramularia collo-cygni]|uniref:Serine hydrolase domain-containing protein n=1 Tax=Ramularia collo-cygni TaxID=112498 RepID=A0A2D3V074_9PEZI|nr:uncharacterized protein RCC_09431 [Ramularia collo-cygni]CZT23717.1 uncharacterized protein RCC_09431 [Ramularia collo-cygni]